MPTWPFGAAVLRLKGSAETSLGLPDEGAAGRRASGVVMPAQQGGFLVLLLCQRDIVEGIALTGLKD